MTVATGAPATSPPTFGAHRFRVVVGGLEIGRFSHCTGLGLEYDVLDYREGGEGSYTHKLRGALRPATITLSRGVTDETALLDWFLGRAQEQQRRTVSVFLLDDGGRPLRHWTFDEASPVRWQGPNLHAGSSEAAVEALEIAHRGLLFASPEFGAPRTAPAPTFQRARVAIQGAGEVICWMNPSTYTVTQSNEWAARAGEPVVFGGVGAQELEVELLFDAADMPERSVTDVCTALFGALQPLSDGDADDRDGGRRPPTLTFTWGDSEPFRAVARRLRVRYLLFRADGEPSRATVELALVRIEMPRTLGRTRRLGLLPGQEDDAATRGGPRGAHVVSSNETLPLIAHRYYRDARVWRVIADANDVDDPTRLQPGDRLSIPPHRRARGDGSEPADVGPEPGTADSVGGGVAFPLQVDAAGAVRLTRGADDIRQSIRLVLGTEPGERSMQPEFGCALQQFFFERLDAATLGRVREELLHALGRWEPRIDVLDVGWDVERSDAGELAIQITYVLSGESEAHRLTHDISMLPAAEVTDAA